MVGYTTFDVISTQSLLPHWRFLSIKLFLFGLFGLKLLTRFVLIAVKSVDRVSWLGCVYLTNSSNQCKCCFWCKKIENEPHWKGWLILTPSINIYVDCGIRQRERAKQKCKSQEIIYFYVYWMSIVNIALHYTLQRTSRRGEAVWSDSSRPAGPPHVRRVGRPGRSCRAGSPWGQRWRTVWGGGQGVEHFRVGVVLHHQAPHWWRAVLDVNVLHSF